MKFIIRIGVICLMSVLIVGCSTTGEQNQMDDLNMYMLSHGHNNIP